MVTESVEHVTRSLSQFAVDQDKFGASPKHQDVLQDNNFLEQLFKTVKPEITQVSLSMPASPASIMVAKSCVVSSGSQYCGQVFSTLRAYSGVSTVVSLGHRSSEAGLTWNNLLKMDYSA